MTVFRSPLRPRRALLALLAAAAASGAARAADADPAPAVASPSAHARLSFERVRFGDDRERVGLVGASYLVDVLGTSGLSLGPAVYGAVSGDRGGFFSLGGELAWRQRLLGPLGVELGVYAGGGGGGGSAPGSGLMVRPHADLVWDFGRVALGVSVSRVRYSNGQIGSTQLGLVLDANSDFRFVPAQRLGEPLLAGGRAGLGFDRVQLVAGAYRTPAGRTLRGGAPLPRTISTVGARAEQSLGGNAFWGVEANRAGRGGVGGYAEVLGTVGIEGEAVRDVLSVGARVGAGAAGGGGVSTGGGFLVKGSVYSIVRLSNELGLLVEAGAARAPNGNFRAWQGELGLVWALDGPAGTGAPARPSRTDFSAGVERYDARRHDGSEHALSVATLKLDRYLTPNIYVTGKVQGAVAGAASGYSTAFVGAGWMQPIGSRLALGAELNAGAGGGGGVDAHRALVQPRAWLGVQLTPSIALRAGASRLEAIGGKLGATAFDVGIGVTYGVSAGN